MFEAGNYSLEMFNMHIHITIECIMPNFLGINEDISNLFFHFRSNIDLYECLSLGFEDGLSLSILKEAHLGHLEFKVYFVVDG